MRERMGRAFGPVALFVGVLAVLYLVAPVFGGYPNRFRSARMTDATPVSQIDDNVGALEQTICDALGTTIDTDFSVPVVIPASQKGAVNGVASLDGTGKVPVGQLPAVLPAFAGCLANRITTDQSLTNDTSNVIALNGEIFDTNTFHDTVTNNSRITISIGMAGYYSITGNAYVSTATAAGVVQVSVWSNGGLCLSADTRSVVSLAGFYVVRASIQCVRYLNVGDYVELWIYPTGCTTPVAKFDSSAQYTSLSIAKIPST